MKNFYIFFFLFFAFVLNAQRYVTPQYPVKVTQGITYGTNISILTGSPAPLELKMNVIEPIDNQADRPLVLIAHTGIFLPPLYNGQVTGGLTDSTVVALAGALASRGYVVAPYTYRMGWLPTSPDVNVRTGTLLQAAYRGIQDTRACIRYFKKSVAESGNPYGIDPSRIAVLGVGTGGYLSFGAGSLNDFGEVLLDKFINSQTLTPFIDSNLLGDIWGLKQTPLCMPNHPGYSSNFQFAFNLGGALGDSSWLDGEAMEPAYSGVHCVNDFFAPYYEGAVIVPTTREFVVNVVGTRKAIETANGNGSNNKLKNLSFDPLASLIDAQKSTPITLPLNPSQRIQLGTDNFYGFNLPPVQGSPWDWWDLNTLKFVVSAVNQQRGTNFNADTLHRNGLASNPDMSAEKGRRYVDSCLALFLPRACAALNLGCGTNVKNLKPEEVGLDVSPNPAQSEMIIKSNPDKLISAVLIYDLQGRLVKGLTDLKSNTVTVQKGNLQAGVYIAQVYFGKLERSSQQIMFRD